MTARFDPGPDAIEVTALGDAARSFIPGPPKGLIVPPFTWDPTGNPQAPARIGAGFAIPPPQVVHEALVRLEGGSDLVDYFADDDLWADDCTWPADWMERAWAWLRRTFCWRCWRG